MMSASLSEADGGPPSPVSDELSQHRRQQLLHKQSRVAAYQEMKDKLEAALAQAAQDELHEEEYDIQTDNRVVRNLLSEFDDVHPRSLSRAPSPSSPSSSPPSVNELTRPACLTHGQSCSCSQTAETGFSASDDDSPHHDHHKHSHPLDSTLASPTSLAVSSTSISLSAEELQLNRSASLTPVSTPTHSMRLDTPPQLDTDTTQSIPSKAQPEEIEEPREKDKITTTQSLPTENTQFRIQTTAPVEVLPAERPESPIDTSKVVAALASLAEQHSLHPLLSLPSHAASPIPPVTHASVIPSPSPSLVAPLIHSDQPVFVRPVKKTIILRSTYLLTAIDGCPCNPSQSDYDQPSFLSLNLTPSPRSAKGLEVIEGETVVRHMDFDCITRCESGMDDMHIVSITYLHTMVNDEGMKKRLDSCDRVEFRLASLFDAQHIRDVVNAVIAPEATSLTSSRSCHIRGQICIHKSWVEQFTGGRTNAWTKRYIRLFSNRLIIYRTPQDALPLQVYPLTIEGVETHATISTNQFQHIIVEFPQDEETQLQTVVWRCADAVEYQQWMSAMQSEESFIEAPSIALTSTSASTTAAPAPLAAEGMDSLMQQLSIPPDRISLSPLLSSQQSFVVYLRELSVVAPMFPTSLLDLSAWLKSTPNPFLRKRIKAFDRIDATLQTYHALVKTLDSLWSEVRLCMWDAWEQSGSGQLGFAFPGFDSQLFDVGRLSVISAHQLFSSHSHSLAFTHTDFTAAIESSSPAKEMMQYAPELTQLYEQGQKEQADTISYQSQRLLLHNCTLASYLKAQQHVIKNGEIIEWQEILTKQQIKRNLKLLHSFLPVAYLYNPTLPTIHQLIQLQTVVMSKQAQAGTPQPYVSFGSHIVPNVKRNENATVFHQGTRCHGAAVTRTESRLRGLFSSGGNSAKKNNKGDKEKQPAPLPSHPHGPVSKPSQQHLPNLSHCSSFPLSPSIAELRCLVDSLHFLLLLRTCLQYRRHSLCSVLSAAEAFLNNGDKHEHKRDREQVAALIKTINAEKQRILVALSVLPRQEEIEREDAAQRKEKKQKKLNHDMMMKERETDHQKSVMKEKREAEQRQIISAATQKQQQKQHTKGVSASVTNSVSGPQPHHRQPLPNVTGASSEDKVAQDDDDTEVVLRIVNVAAEEEQQTEQDTSILKETEPVPIFHLSEVVC